MQVLGFTAAAAALLLFQLVFGSVRRRRRSPLLHGALWLAHTLLPPLTAYALGLMQASPAKSALYPVWALSLFLVAGGAGAVTAHDLGDNGRWMWRVFVYLQCYLFSTLMCRVLLSSSSGAAVTYRCLEGEEAPPPPPPTGVSCQRTTSSPSPFPGVERRAAGPGWSAAPPGRGGAPPPGWSRGGGAGASGAGAPRRRARVERRRRGGAVEEGSRGGEQGRGRGERRRRGGAVEGSCGGDAACRGAAGVDVQAPPGWICGAGAGSASRGVAGVSAAAGVEPWRGAAAVTRRAGAPPGWSWSRVWAGAGEDWRSWDGKLGFHQTFCIPFGPFGENLVNLVFDSIDLSPWMDDRRERI